MKFSARRHRTSPVLWLVPCLVASAIIQAASQDGGELLGEAHFELVPEVQAILDSGGESAQLASAYLKYATDLVNDVDALDESVAPDVKLHDVEPLGFTGLAGLKNFRRQRNAAFSYDRAVVTEMRFPAPEIIEADVCTERTDAATGSKIAIVINAKNRWVKGMLVERWDGITQLPPGSDCGPE